MAAHKPGSVKVPSGSLPAMAAASSPPPDTMSIGQPLSAVLATLVGPLNLRLMAQDQLSCSEVASVMTSTGLQIQPLPSGNYTILCNVSGGQCCGTGSIRIRIIFQDPDLLPGCLGSRSVSYSNSTTKLTGRENLTKNTFCVGPVGPNEKENQVKMYKKYCLRYITSGSMSNSQIRIKLKSRVRIRIKVKSRIRICIKRVWIRITAGG
jgi:hypothetical protein